MKLAAVWPRQIRVRIRKGDVERWSLWQRAEREAEVVKLLEARGWSIVGRQVRRAK